jgi:phosphatidylglycerophosphate synthase
VAGRAMVSSGPSRARPMPALDAIVLAEGPHARERVAGLTLRERARRVAVRAGATRVLVVDGVAARAELPPWWQAGEQGRLLVVRASDQVVHTPLVAPLLAAGGDAIAVAPDDTAATDVPPGAYAGALIVSGERATAAVEALAGEATDEDVAATLREAGAAAVPHGAIARHPVTSRAERKAAARLLYRIVHKPQDNAITRYLYRPVSFPMTRMFLHTPITPNQISYLVAALVAVGIWLTARASMNAVIAGTALCLFASYVDCCDGEVARLKLLSSKLGAWLDTIIDELSSVAYMMAIGWHCHLHFGPAYFGDLGFDPWTVTIWVGVATYLVSIYCVYYNIVVVVGSANSQDYVGRFEVVPGDAPGSVRLRPAATKAIATDDMSPVVRFVATYMPYIVRRDFISWAALGCAALHLTQVAFASLILGGVVTAVIVTIDHVRLRLQRRAIARQGLVLESR